MQQNLENFSRNILAIKYTTLLMIYLIIYKYLWHFKITWKLILVQQLKVNFKIAC